MHEHTIHYTLSLPLPRERVFDFFADAANLERITPPELQFSILTPLPIIMNKGILIDYRLKLFGFPFTWKTRITAKMNRFLILTCLVATLYITLIIPSSSSFRKIIHLAENHKHWRI
jgi:ligand-binding SRPBCC domain-containing protein